MRKSSSKSLCLLCLVIGVCMFFGFSASARQVVESQEPLSILGEGAPAPYIPEFVVPLIDDDDDDDDGSIYVNPWDIEPVTITLELE